MTSVAGMPDREDRLIMALGLGSTGHDYSGSPIPLRPKWQVVPAIADCFNCSTTRFRRSPCLKDSAICHDYVEPRGKNCMYLYVAESILLITNEKQWSISLLLIFQLLFSYDSSLIPYMSMQYYKCNHQLLIMYSVCV